MNLLRGCRNCLDFFQRLQKQKRLESIETEASNKKPSFSSGEKVFNRLREMEKEMEHTQHRLQQLEKEKKQLEPWGDFDWDLLKELENNGFKFRFMISPTRKWQPEWEEKYYIQKVNDLEGNRYFLIVEKTNDSENRMSAEEISDVDELILPRISLKQIDAEIFNLNEKANSLKE